MKNYYICYTQIDYYTNSELFFNITIQSDNAMGPDLFDEIKAIIANEKEDSMDENISIDRQISIVNIMPF